jgi:hypothetical protein
VFCEVLSYYTSDIFPALFYCPHGLIFFQLIANKGNKQERENAPYIAAKFPQRNIPYTFHIGSGEVIEGFTNRKLERGKKYRIFVRAVVDTPQKVHTSSMVHCRAT